MSSTPSSWKADGASARIQIPRTTDPTGWTVSTTDVMAAGRRGRLMLMSSSSRTSSGRSRSRIVSSNRSGNTGEMEGDSLLPTPGRTRLFDDVPLDDMRICSGGCNRPGSGISQGPTGLASLARASRGASLAPDSRHIDS